MSLLPQINPNRESVEGFFAAAIASPKDGFTENEKSKLTPQTLAEMSSGQLRRVTRDTLTDLHLEMGRELFDETNLTDDRHYGLKNAQRHDYTEALGRIVRLHGDSPVGQEAASMLAECLSRMSRVESTESERNGPSPVAEHEKYGFAGGGQLFRHLSLFPGSMGGSQETLQTLHDTKLSTT